MRRCLKLYHAVGHLNTIFRLIKGHESTKDDTVCLKERLLAAIKGFLIEHTLFPVKFLFNGWDLVNELRTKNRGEFRIIDLEKAKKTAQGQKKKIKTKRLRRHWL